MKTRFLSVLGVAVLGAAMTAAETGAARCPDGAAAQREAGRAGSLELCVDGAGRRHGPVITRFASGQKRTEVTYRHGDRHGGFAEWNASGTQIAVGQFRDDASEGTWVYYDPAENRMSVRTFTRGDEVRHALANDASCAQWSRTPDPARHQFAAELFIRVAGVSNRPGPLEAGFPFSVAMGQCLAEAARPLARSIDRACEAQPSERPFGAETMKRVVDGSAECVRRHR